jgi:two-component system phosphate regulon response regulator PhoB
VSATILIVEDEQDLVDMMRFNLEREGMRTTAVTHGKQALETIAEGPKPDLVLLDLMLPDMRGTDVCRRIRADEATRDIPVMMVTARVDEIDRVVGFEVGADDYVTKPFSVRELMCRVKALLRRGGHASPTTDPEALHRGRLRIDREAHRTWVDEVEVELTALEFRLLLRFMANHGRVQSRDALLQDVWGHQAQGIPTRTVDTHIQRLRKKLGPAAPYIETLRGVGYRFLTAETATAG